jgi:hypothetical protein
MRKQGSVMRVSATAGPVNTIQEVPGHVFLQLTTFREIEFCISQLQTTFKSYFHSWPRENAVVSTQSVSYIHIHVHLFTL